MNDQNMEMQEQCARSEQLPTPSHGANMLCCLPDQLEHPTTLVTKELERHTSWIAEPMTFYGLESDMNARDEFSQGDAPPFLKLLQIKEHRSIVIRD